LKDKESTRYACWCHLPKIIKSSPCLSKLQLTKVASFYCRAMLARP